MYARKYNMCSTAGEFLDHAADRVFFALMEVISLIITGVDTRYVLPVLVSFFFFMNYIKCYHKFYYGAISIDTSGAWVRCLSGFIPILYALSNGFDETTFIAMLVSIISKSGWIVFTLLNVRQFVFLMRVNKDESLITFLLHPDVIRGIVFAVVYCLVCVCLVCFRPTDFVLVVLCQTCISGGVFQYLVAKILNMRIMKVADAKALFTMTESLLIVSAYLVTFYLCQYFVDEQRVFHLWLGLLAAWYTLYTYYFVAFYFNG